MSCATKTDLGAELWQGDQPQRCALQRDGWHPVPGGLGLEDLHGGL
jgi:hypothetical protein